MENKKIFYLFNIIKLLAIISGLICIYAGFQTYLYFEGSVPSTTLDFYHSVGLFFIGIGFFIASFLWAIAEINLIKKEV